MGVESENRPQRGQFLPDLQAHSPAMGQKYGEKWTAAVDLQPALPQVRQAPRCPHTSLALESRFDLAYNAAHALCLAALRRKGYRASNRYIVFQVLPHTLGLGPEVWRVLDKCHNTRNLGEYEGLLDVDARLVADLITATQAVADAVPQ